MTEGEQQIPQEEIRKENPVVGAARAAARGVIETDESIKAWRDTLTAKDKSVYRAWADAVDNFHAQMSETDRKRLSTKLESIGMRLRGAFAQVASSTIDLVWRTLSKGGRIAGVAMFGAGLGALAVPGIGQAVAPALMQGGAILFGGSVAADVLVRPKTLKHKGGILMRKLPVGVEMDRALQEKSKRAAMRWEARKTGAYKRKLSVEQVRNFGDLVKQRTRDILTGFAYPEGKPVKPMVK